MKFHEQFKKGTPYMPHTLITYIFNIFSIFTKMAKNPKVIRKFKVENIIDPKEIKIGCIMHNALLNQLQLCTATSSLQNIFATPTLSFKLFCPSLHANIHDKSTKRTYNESNNDKSQGRNNANRNVDKGQENDKRPKIETRGSIINKTGKKIYLPKGLEKKYCSNFLDAGETCRHGDNCNFVHAVYPGGFTANDKPLVENLSKMNQDSPLILTAIRM